jgi:glyoxylase-like metal-dependent hydrolase (beta-lactamase superfamily II)
LSLLRDRQKSAPKSCDGPAIPKPGLVESKTNIPVIRKENDLIIVDIGSGDKYQPSDGRLSGNLQAAGIDPETITKVVFTHAHPDHVWGALTADGRPQISERDLFRRSCRVGLLDGSGVPGQHARRTARLR